MEDQNDPPTLTMVKALTAKLVRQADALTSKDLAQLNNADRENAIYEIHGICKEMAETNADTCMHLQAFEAALQKMSKSSVSNAYKMAVSMGPEYVQDKKLRIRFLRAEKFDTTLAAQRFLRYFATKLELFGSELLVKDITWDDLNKEDQGAFLHYAPLQFTAADMAGRDVIFFAPPANSQEPITTASIYRANFFSAMAVSEQETIQKKGMVIVVYCVGQRLQLNRFHLEDSDIFADSITLMAALPLRINSFHLCSDSLAWRFLFTRFKLGVPMPLRIRIREHSETITKIRIALQSYGIPVECFLFFLHARDSGVCNKVARRVDWASIEKENTNHESRGRGLLSEDQNYPQEEEEDAKPQQHDEAPSAHDVSNQTTARYTAQTVAVVKHHIEAPDKYDVLLGRGKMYYNHVGNVLVRELIAKNFHVYDRAQFKEKAAVAKSILDHVHSVSGRFLKEPEAGKWVEVDDEAAIYKIGSLFRTLRAEQKSKNCSS